jgi:DUF4097 and DUF4098 domain-containing protein YvlB
LIPRSSEKIWQRDWLRAVILVALVGASIFMSAQLFVVNGPVPPGHFSYLQNIPQTRGSLQISNVNGLVTLSTWSGNQVLVNGTIVPTGVGATPDQVNLLLANSNGAITINVIYPAPTSDRGYTLDLGVFLPAASNITTLGVSLTSGRVQMSDLQVSQLNIYTASGSVSARLHTITPTGSYTFSTDTGSINLDVPTTRGFQLTATTYFGRVWGSLDNCQVQSSAWNTFLQVGRIVTASCGGSGASTFNASTHNGDITINRT